LVSRQRGQVAVDLELRLLVDGGDVAEPLWQRWFRDVDFGHGFWTS
jgi:hypothetical protein